MKPCPTLIAFGSCTGGSCTFNHDVHVCAPCGVVSTSKDWHDKHLAGVKHRRQMAERGPPPPGALHCATCDIYCSTSGQYHSHLRGPKHGQKARSLSFMAVLAEASKDKHGVMVSHDEEGLDFSIVELQESEEKTITIQTQVPYSTVSLVDVKLSSNKASSP
jgi:helicase MOV-10